MAGGREGGDGTDRGAEKDAADRRLGEQISMEQRLKAAGDVLPEPVAAIPSAGEASALPGDVDERAERESAQPFSGDDSFSPEKQEEIRQWLIEDNLDRTRRLIEKLNTADLTKLNQTLGAN